MAWGWAPAGQANTNTPGESEEAHRRVYGGQAHKSNWTHELVAGAASFAGIKVWEDHQRGQSDDHESPKASITACVHAEVARLFETKGMDEIDKIRATEHAKKNAHEMYDEHYVRRRGADQYDPSRYGHHESFNRW